MKLEDVFPIEMTSLFGDIRSFSGVLHRLMSTQAFLFQGGDAQAEPRGWGLHGQAEKGVQNIPMGLPILLMVQQSNRCHPVEGGTSS